MQVNASNQYHTMAAGGTDAPDPERQPKKKENDSLSTSFAASDTVTISRQARVLMAAGGTDAPDPERRPKE